MTTARRSTPSSVVRMCSSISSRAASLSWGADGVAQLLADRDHGVERVHRALGNQGDICRAGPAHLFFGEAQQVGSVQPHLAALDHGGRFEQPHQAQRRGGFAGAGFAHQPQPLARPQKEADAVYRAHWPARRQIADAQVAHVEHGARASVRLLFCRFGSFVNCHKLLTRIRRNTTVLRSPRRLLVPTLCMGIQVRRSHRYQGKVIQIRIRRSTWVDWPSPLPSLPHHGGGWEGVTGPIKNRLPPHHRRLGRDPKRNLPNQLYQLALTLIHTGCLSDAPRRRAINASTSSSLISFSRPGTRSVQAAFLRRA